MFLRPAAAAYIIAHDQNIVCYVLEAQRCASNTSFGITLHPQGLVVICKVVIPYKASQIERKGTAECAV